MTVGLLTLELHLSESHSLKDKRMVLRRAKERVRSRHNAAVAEVDFQDTWQRSRLAVVSVSSERAVVEKTLAAVQRELEDQVLAGLVVRSGIDLLDVD
jgi:uncharacterized protein YlxP (DUF503 family)